MELSQCSPASNASQGITANPEISGIGVRTAIYIQVVLSLVHAIVAGYDGRIDDFELKSLIAVFLGILLPGCALLLSAIIQAKTFGLSAYHAMIVLFLSWINNTTALTFFAYIVGDQYYRPFQPLEESQKQNEGQHDITELDREWAEADGLARWCVLEKVERTLDKLNCDKKATKSTSLKPNLWDLEIQKWTLWRKKKIMTMIPNKEDSPELQRRWGEEWEENERKLREMLPNRDQIEKPFDISVARSNVTRFLSRKPILWMGALASVHLMLLSAFGLWFWSTLPNFGINRECIPSIRFVFFTKSIPITSKVLRSRSKSIYIFSSLPVINIYLWLVIFLSASAAASLAIAAVSIIVGLLLMVVMYFIGPRIRRAPTGVAVSPPRTLRYLTQFFFALTIITTLAVQTSLIALTELTIAHNQHLIQSKESDWTFGQTLALMLTLIPLSEAVKFLWEKRPRALKESGREDRESRHGRERGEDRKSREDWESGEGRKSREGLREVELGADNSG
jgi:hypothetical protein